jgi:undecaprenyl diphosphate synthase
MWYLAYFLTSLCLVLTYKYVYQTYIREFYYKMCITQIPRHIGVIADGNGRWAQNQGKERTYGHNFGAQRFDTIIKEAVSLKVEMLTFYVFSTDNWKRPESEVNYIFDIFSRKLSTISEYNNNTKENLYSKALIYFVGSRKRMPMDIIAKMATIEQENLNKKSTVISLFFAVDYGGREEIVDAVQSIISNCPKVKPEDITINKLSAHMCLNSHIWPDPDLIIRTSGEHRISNFMLWHIGYSELYFTPVYWPNFVRIDLLKALAWYSSRVRRFGNLTIK